MRWLRRLYVLWIPPRAKFALKSAQYRVMPRPMMSAEERATIRSLLRTGRYSRVVEFGAGGSTLYFPRYLPPDGRWTAFEFDRAWYDFLCSRTPPQTQIHHVVDLEEAARQGRDALDEADLVLIDGGPNRSSCLDLVRRVCSGADVLLHDAQRPDYAEAKGRFAREVVLSRCYGVDPAAPFAAGGLSLLLHGSGSDGCARRS